MILAAMLAMAAASGAADAAVALGVPATQTRTLVLSPAQMFKLADLASSRGDLAMASDIYSALERNPDSDIRAEARFRHAKQLLGQKRNRDAALLLRSLVDEKPAAVVARIELAHTLDLIGE